MDLELIIQTLEALFKGSSVKVTYVLKEEAEEPSRGPKVSEVGLSEALTSALTSQGLERLYSYQYEAYKLISSGRDVAICSRTATGKTEAFMIPILDGALKEGSRTLLIYPTKALAKDQRSRLTKLCLSIGVRASIYDGDTPQRERLEITKNPPTIFITNPDMLHHGLTFSPRFREAVGGVDTIVLDEAHVYEGSFGSHMKLLLERLRKDLDREVQMVASGATIGNPE